MSEDPFGKWWPCLKKHDKRLNHWLPYAKNLQASLNGRELRYFTLCARSMIDVYMLVKEGVLPFDQANRRVSGVSFCESVEEIIPEMKELLGVEESAFFARLEDLVLFQDTQATRALTTTEQLVEYVEREGESLDEGVATAIEAKRRHLQFQKLFPFDFLNLDFCDRYYGRPPDVLRIHETVKQILEWQAAAGMQSSGEAISIDRFVLAITCRVDDAIPAPAVTRLKEIVEANRNNHTDYRADMERLGRREIAQWSRDNPLDFFMAAWPKEIARLAESASLDIHVKEHLFYDRVNDEGVPYHMVSLVAEFTKASQCTTYLPAVRRCLDPNFRTEIAAYDPEHGDGAVLLQDLREIVNLRNQQAAYFQRKMLPEPLSEIKRLRALGVPV